MWNQFFVIEEYTGPDPVLVGRVSTAERWLRRTEASQTEPIWLLFIFMYLTSTYAGQVFNLAFCGLIEQVAVHSSGT